MRKVFRCGSAEIFVVWMIIEFDVKGESSRPEIVLHFGLWLLFMKAFSDAIFPEPNTV
jgi:hypothetical protein